jgi:hypothetical protein
MTVREREVPVNWERTQKIALCGELAFEEAMDLCKTEYEMNELQVSNSSPDRKNREWRQTANTVLGDMRVWENASVHRGAP